MSRARLPITVALVAALAVGCSQRREEIKVIDDREYICTWIERALGGDRDYTCFPVGDERQP